MKASCGILHVRTATLPSPVLAPVSHWRHPWPGACPLRHTYLHTFLPHSLPLQWRPWVQRHALPRPTPSSSAPLWLPGFTCHNFHPLAHSMTATRLQALQARQTPNQLPRFLARCLAGSRPQCLAECLLALGGGGGHLGSSKPWDPFWPNGTVIRHPVPDPGAVPSLGEESITEVGRCLGRYGGQRADTLIA